MVPTIAQALVDARRTLDDIDARALLRHALGASAADLIAHPDRVLSSAQNAAFAALVARRCAGEPVAYIIGTREFFSLEFSVTPAVLIPRPDTELLIEFVLEHITPERAGCVLDLGTGSGCVAISVAKARPRSQVVAVDSSAAALAVARDNVRRHSADNVELIAGDWLGAVAGRRFDLIVANPPYVAAGDPHLTQGDLRFEPLAALFAGGDGLDCIRLIIAAAPQYLSRGGWLAFEHGYDQAMRCRELLARAGFGGAFTRTDLAGAERVSGGQWVPKC